MRIGCDSAGDYGINDYFKKGAPGGAPFLLGLIKRDARCGLVHAIARTWIGCWCGNH